MISMTRGVGTRRSFVRIAESSLDVDVHLTETPFQSVLSVTPKCELFMYESIKRKYRYANFFRTVRSINQGPETRVLY